jgi:hypothetical protein
MLASLLHSTTPSQEAGQHLLRSEWNGRELKNQARLDRITVAEVKILHSTDMKTSYAFKMMRKDWNLLTCKMFWLCKYAIDRQIQLAEALNELDHQIDEVIQGPDFSMFWGLDSSWLAPITFEFQIINPYAAQLFRAIQKIDYMMALIFSAEREGLIDRQQRIRIIAGVVFAYIALKRQLIPAMDETAESSTLN